MRMVKSRAIGHSDGKAQHSHHEDESENWKLPSRTIKGCKTDHERPEPRDRKVRNSSNCQPAGSLGPMCANGPEPNPSQGDDQADRQITKCQDPPVNAVHLAGLGLRGNQLQGNREYHAAYPDPEGLKQEKGCGSTDCEAHDAEGSNRPT